MANLVGEGSRRGETWFGRAGDIVQQPHAWAGVAGLLVLTGSRGRRAALRGGACYVTAALIHILIKPLVGRRRPPGAGKGRIGPVTSSFPSGHAASDLAFTFGAAQELPIVLVPLSAATAAAHWSLVRSRGHYPTDVFAGGALGLAVALAAAALWPPAARARLEARLSGPDDAGGAGPAKPVDAGHRPSNGAK